MKIMPMISANAVQYKQKQQSNVDFEGRIKLPSKLPAKGWLMGGVAAVLFSLGVTTGCSMKDNNITGLDKTNETELFIDKPNSIRDNTRTNAEAVADTLRAWGTRTLGLQIPNRTIKMISFDDDADGSHCIWRPDASRTDSEHLAFIEQRNTNNGVPNSYISKVFSLLPSINKLMCEEKLTYDNPYTSSNPNWMNLTTKEYENVGTGINYRVYNSSGLLNNYSDDSQSDDVLQAIGPEGTKLRNFVYKTNNGPGDSEEIICDEPMAF